MIQSLNGRLPKPSKQLDVKVVDILKIMMYAMLVSMQATCPPNRVGKCTSHLDGIYNSTRIWWRAAYLETNPYRASLEWCVDFHTICLRGHLILHDKSYGDHFDSHATPNHIQSVLIISLHVLECYYDVEFFTKYKNIIGRLQRPSYILKKTDILSFKVLTQCCHYWTLLGTILTYYQRRVLGDF